jgi:hypothetical protein
MVVKAMFNRLVIISFTLFCAACAVSPRSADREGVSAVGLTPGEWAALSRPGPSHKLLEMFAGQWDVKLTFWSDPKATGESSKGTSEISWILGGRFLQENFRGQLGGEEYLGFGIMGYDNGSRTFKTVWADSLNTAITTASGRYDPDTSTFALESQLYDPLVSGVKTILSTLQVNSANSYTFSMTDVSPDGRRFTSLEMQYSRR